MDTGFDAVGVSFGSLGSRRVCCRVEGAFDATGTSTCSGSQIIAKYQ